MLYYIEIEKIYRGGYIMSFFKNFPKIFIDPKTVFDEIKEKPTMLFAILYVMIISFITTYLSHPITKITFQKTKNLYLELKGSVPTGYELIENIPPLVTASITLFSILFIWALSSLIYWFVCKIFKGTASLKQIFSLNAYIFVFTVTTNIIVVGVQLLLQNDVNAFSLAVFNPTGDISQINYNLMSQASIFSIWGTFLTAMGLNILNEYKKQKGYLIAFSLFIITIFILSFNAVRGFQ